MGMCLWSDGMSDGEDLNAAFNSTDTTHISPEKEKCFLEK